MRFNLKDLQVIEIIHFRQVLIFRNFCTIFLFAMLFIIATDGSAALIGSSGFVFFDNAINVTPSAVGSWANVDVSSYVPAGATGVLLAFVNRGGSNYRIDARHPDSTDNFYSSDTTNVRSIGHIYTVVGINSSRIFEAARENAACDILLLGYTDGEITLFVNKIDISALYSGSGSWQDLNVSSYVPADAKGIILRVYSSTAGNVVVARADGSTTDWSNSQVIALGWYTIIIKNNNQIVEAYRSSTNGRFYLSGYINGTAPITLFTNPYDVSTATAGSWVNTCVGSYTSSIADGAILVRKNTANAFRQGQSRIVGSSNNWYAVSDIRNYQAHWEFSGLNTSQCFQQYIEANTQDYYLMGYAEPAYPPSVNSVSIDDDISTPPNEIDLAAGVTRKVLCNGTVSDDNGYDTIDNVTAIIYAIGNGTKASDPEDNNTLYKNNSCTLSAGYSTTKKDFNCSFNMWYYAQNGTWSCNATATDSQSASGSAVANSTVNNLIAFNISSLILDYGNLAPGAASPSSVLFYITNLGNTRIDLSLNGSNMSCTAGTIPSSSQHYNITGTDQAYSLMLALSNSAFLVSDFDLDKKVTSDSNRTTYWRIQIPTAVKGQCTGIISLSAQQG